MASLDCFPDALILSCDDGCDESPGGSEYGENQQVVEDKERIETRSDVPDMSVSSPPEES
jgi:hypothetical protein